MDEFVKWNQLLDYSSHHCCLGKFDAVKNVCVIEREGKRRRERSIACGRRRQYNRLHEWTTVQVFVVCITLCTLNDEQGCRRCGKTVENDDEEDDEEEVDDEILIMTNATIPSIDRMCIVFYPAINHEFINITLLKASGARETGQMRRYGSPQWQTLMRLHKSHVR